MYDLIAGLVSGQPRPPTPDCRFSTDCNVASTLAYYPNDKIDPTLPASVEPTLITDVGPMLYASVETTLI